MPADFAVVLAEACRRVAVQQQARADQLRQHATLYGLTLRSLEFEADEYAGRAEVYRTWAAALSFPGGPIAPDWIRFGTLNRDWARP